MPSRDYISLKALLIYPLPSGICRKKALFFVNLLKNSFFGYDFADFVSNRLKSEARQWTIVLYQSSIGDDDGRSPAGTKDLGHSQVI